MAYSFANGRKAGGTAPRGKVGALPEKRHNAWVFFLAGIVLLGVFLSLSQVDARFYSQPEDMYALETWYSLQDGQPVYVTLPGSLTVEPGSQLTLYCDGLTGDGREQVLLVENVVARPRVVLDGELLYAYRDQAFPRNEPMRSKLCCCVSLPLLEAGSVLSLTLQDTGTGILELPGVYAGTLEALIRYLFAEDSFTLVGVVVLLLLSILALGVHAYLASLGMRDPRFLHAACFLFLCAAWRALDSSLAQHLSRLSPVVCYLSFYAFMTLAIPMLLFVRSTGNLRRYRCLDVCLGLFFLNAGAQSLLDYLTPLSFIQMLPVTHLLLAGGSLLVAGLLLREYRNTRSQELRVIFWAFVFLAASGLLAIVLYWALKIPYYGLIFQLGLLIFVLCLLRALITTLAANFRFKTEAAVYKRLSREDRLTGLGNRRDFEEFLDGLEKMADAYENVALVFLDLNRLKYVNDRFGHSAGDELIVGAALCLEQVFAGQGVCYRIGGDEFAVVMLNPPPSAPPWEGRLEAVLAEYNRSHRFTLSISLGVSFLRDQDGRIKRMSDWKQEADQNMYRNKRQRMAQEAANSGGPTGREEATGNALDV